MRSLIPLIVLLAGSPALAGNGTPIPEPSNVALFGLGFAGLIVGRIAARRRARGRNNPD